MGRLDLVAAIAVYVALAHLALRISHRGVSRASFALVNVVAVGHFWQWSDGAPLTWKGARTAVFLAVVLVHFVLLRRAAVPGRPVWPAVVFPLAVLVVFKYSQWLWEPVAAARGVKPETVQLQLAAAFIGLSYMAFRLSHLTVQVRNGEVKMPGLADYLGFAFFVPTLAVGPINPASVHFGSLETRDPARLPTSRAALRILVGATKYLFLASALAHLTYTDLVFDGNPHSAFDWGVSLVAYYLYLYCNFSGFCDMAIGAAGLVGVSVIENFDNPLIARNIKDFWSRWHISLSAYVREMVFSPLSKRLAGAWGPSRLNLAIAVALMVTFVLTGVWHGAGWGFLLFGLVHGGAMVLHHYYFVLLRKRLSRDRFRAYNESALIRVVAVVLTFAFVTGSFFVFAHGDLLMKRLFVGKAPPAVGAPR